MSRATLFAIVLAALAAAAMPPAMAQTEGRIRVIGRAVVDAVPDHEAMVCADRRLTYAQADERATRLAHHLAGLGIGPGDHVALYLYNGTEYLEGMLAAFKLRAVPINVNYRYGQEELRYLLADADARAVVFHREFASAVDSGLVGGGGTASGDAEAAGLRLAIEQPDSATMHRPVSASSRALTAASPRRFELNWHAA